MHYEAIDRWNSIYLEHYGVKGMKWGVRHDYQKAGNRHLKYSEGSFDTNYTVEKTTAEDMMKQWKKQSSQRIKPSVNKKEYKKEKSKTIKMGMLAAAEITMAVPTAGLSLLYLPGTISSMSKAGKAKKAEKVYFKNRDKNSVIDKNTGLYTKKKKMSNDEDASKVNPGFNRYNSNYKSNCGLCTVAYDMRRRGYDVTAKPRYSGTGIGDLKTWYPNAKTHYIDARDAAGNYSSRFARQKMLTELSKQKNSRGDIRMKWPFGGGHSVSYEVNKKGKVTIRDTQSNKTYKDANDILSYAFLYSYTRLDNVEPNIKAIKKECVR